MFEFQFSIEAAKKINEIINKKKEANLEENFYFRIEVTGGGCSGFQYKFYTSSNLPLEDEYIFLLYPEEKMEKNTKNCKIVKIDLNEYNNKNNDTTKPKVVIDSMSMEYLNGSVLEYHSSIFKSSFSIQNPNIKAKCGCGNSFAV